MWTIFKVFIEFVTILLLFFLCFVFLVWRHVGSFLPDQGLNPHLPALEGEVLTTGPPGKSLLGFLRYLSRMLQKRFCKQGRRILGKYSVMLEEEV